MRAKLEAPASPLITVMYKIGMNMDNTENSMDREAITKNNFPKLTQSLVPLLVDLAELLLSPTASASVEPVKAYTYSNTPINAIAVNNQRN